MYSNNADTLLAFQSTCLREARPPVLDALDALANFNPRACVRHDVITRYLGASVRFQSTCLREARHQARLTGAPIEKFQSTCLREARLSAGPHHGNPRHFNPRACVRHDRRRCLRDRAG